MNENNEDKCLEYEEKYLISDQKVMFYFAQHDIYDINELKQLEISKRNKIIEAEKSKKGVTIRQLSRITGITKSVIDRTEGQCTCPLVPPLVPPLSRAYSRRNSKLPWFYSL
ncbi:hypothetical protein NVS47_13975 [Dehalobacterium formicoaceticum]|uniref:HTH cro/C1-type domain-containing protein n=1 Tax=Dehalobacterium formicoaceticum TaxID=51515 RepID=A0ABT1Y6U3_9FIRM|nr:hypothetical protein [Dehalobacterium formicoaceticum]MCR6546606.1 hypothetical protein [Dehalobacterium formicoaceticum]